MSEPSLHFREATLNLSQKWEVQFILSSMSTSMVRTALSCDPHRMHLHGPERIRRFSQRSCTLAGARTASLSPAIVFNRPKGGMSWGRDIPARAKVAACHSLVLPTRSIRPSRHLWDNVKAIVGHSVAVEHDSYLHKYCIMSSCCALGALLPVLSVLAFRRSPGW